MQRGCCLGAAGAGFWGADARRLLRIEGPRPAPRAGVEGVRRLTLGAERGRAAPVGLSGNLGGCVCGVPGAGPGACRAVAEAGGPLPGGAMKPPRVTWCVGRAEGPSVFLSGFLGKAALGARHLGRKCLPARFLCFPTRTTSRRHRPALGDPPPPHPAGVCPAPGPAAGAGTWWRQPAWGLVVGSPPRFVVSKQGRWRQHEGDFS